MHEMQTIVTDVCGVCQSVCHAAQLSFTVPGSFDAAFTKSLWPLVSHLYRVVQLTSDCLENLSLKCANWTLLTCSGQHLRLSGILKY